MSFRPMLIVNSLLVAGMAAVSAWAWSAIPNGTQLPVHWGIDGAPDRYGDKSEVLILLPLIGAGVAVLLWVLPRLDPRRENVQASAKFWNAAAILSVGVLAYAHTLVAVNAVGYKVDMINALVPALSLLFVGIGNYLGKTRSNWFGGVRTPWTLSSDYAWEKTHRWAGRLFVLSGVMGFATWLVYSPQSALLVLIGAITVSALCSIVLSYVFWRADPDRQPNGG